MTRKDVQALAAALKARPTASVDVLGSLTPDEVRALAGKKTVNPDEESNGQKE